jgi:hypothetical protein
VSFSNSFGGFAVIHAAFLMPERRKYFEQELKRVGVDRFEVIETKRVTERDERMRKYREPAAGLLSLIDGFLAAIDFAESAGWESIVMMEDDVAFRRTFDRYWAGVEQEVRTTGWGVLTLHRTRTDGRFLTSEPFFDKTRLVPVTHNTAAQCVIVRRPFYNAFRQSIFECIDRGYPCDFFYGIFSHLNPGCLFATNRNLTGQAAGVPSSLQHAPLRPQNTWFMFRSGNYLEALVLNFLHAQFRKFRPSGRPVPPGLRTL